MELHECNLQPPSDKTCPRLFVNRLRHPTGAPLTPLALALLRRRLENITSKELIFLRFPFIFGFTPGGRSHLPTSRRQGPPGSLLCPPDRPFISPTPPLGGCSSGGPTRGLSSPASPLSTVLPSNTLFQTAKISLLAHSPSRHGSARPPSPPPTLPSYRTSSTLPSHPHSRFRNAALKKKKKKNSTHHIFYFEASADVKVLPPPPSIFPPHFFLLLSFFFPISFPPGFLILPPPSPLTSITPLLPNLLRACAVHSGRQRGIADRAAVEEHVLINLNQG